jgi:hypothetical protein
MTSATRSSIPMKSAPDWPVSQRSRRRGVRMARKLGAARWRRQSRRTQLRARRGAQDRVGPVPPTAPRRRRGSRCGARAAAGRPRPRAT